MQFRYKNHSIGSKNAIMIFDDPTTLTTFYETQLFQRNTHAQWLKLNGLIITIVNLMKNGFSFINVCSFDLNEYKCL